MLNLANRSAAKQANTKAGIIPIMSTSIAFFSCIDASQSNLNRIHDGATPKETISARESRSLPMGENIFSALAASPSNRSNIAARPIKMLPKYICSAPYTQRHVGKPVPSARVMLVYGCAVRIYTIAIQPQNKLPSVSRFGKCFM